MANPYDATIAAHEARTNGHAVVLDDCPPDDFFEGPIAFGDDDQEPSPAPSTDPLDVLRTRGALVGYDAMVEATAIPPVPIWYDGVEARHMVELSGPSGHGKSTLASLIVVARANPTGVPVTLLGAPFVPMAAGRFFVVVQEENSLHSWRKREEIACEVLHLPVKETLDRVIRVVRRQVLVGDATWTAVRALGKQGKVGGVLVDSRARVLRRGESRSEDDQAAVAAECFALIEDCSAPLFSVSHTRKGDTPSDIEDVSGSAQRGASLDVLLMVTAKKNTSGKVESSTVRFAKLRDAVGDAHPEPQTFTLSKDLDGRWTLTTAAPTPAPTEDPRPLDEQVLTLLEAHADGLTKWAVRKGLKERTGRDVNPDRLEEAFSVLFATRAITKTSAMHRGRPVALFKARPRTMSDTERLTERGLTERAPNACGESEVEP